MEGFGILLLVLGFHYPWIWSLLGLYLWKLRKLLKLSFFLFVSVIISVRFFHFNTKSINEYIHKVGIVTHIKENLYDTTYAIKFKDYLLNIQGKDGEYSIGERLFVKGRVSLYRKQTVPNGFDTHLYYQSHNILGYLKNPEIETIGIDHHILTYRYQWMNEYKQFESYPWIKSFIFGERLTTHDQSIFRSLGIIHLVQTSGLHLFILMTILKKIWFYLDIPHHFQILLSGFLYLLFFYVQQFDMGSMRLLFMFILIHLNDYFKWRFTRLDCIQFVFIMMLIINIHWAYHLGFLILYLILNMLALISPMIQHHDRMTQRYVMSLSVSLLLLPFHQKISWFTLLLLPLITFIVTGPLFCLVVLTLIFRDIDAFTTRIFSIFVQLLHQLDIKNFYIELPSLTVFLIIIYVLTLIYVFRSPTFIIVIKRMVLSTLILCIPVIQFHVDQTINIYFIDVGQGDAIYVSSPNCKILIDAYRPSYDFLKNQGVTSLDYLILSHSDEDHTKDAYDITSQLRVKKVVLSYYDQKHLSYPSSTMRVKAFDKISCHYLSIDFISPLKAYDSSNNNSLVFKLMIGQLSILFTGDIEKEVEKDLINHELLQLTSDILKVPHHGSKTSSMPSFIDAVDPKYAVISVGESNRYSFPHEDVIHRYTMRGIQVYRTDLHGTIVLTYQQKKEKWSFHLPYLPYF